MTSVPHRIVARRCLPAALVSACFATISLPALALDPAELARTADAKPAAAADAGANAKNYDTTIYERVRREETSLYDQLGGRATIERFVDLGIDYCVADPRISRFFADTNLPVLKLLLVEQICQLSGGPCVYEGRSMQEAHAGMGVGENHFIALVEAFQRAMRESGVPFAQENKVLALLAPMKPVIVQP